MPRASFRFAILKGDTDEDEERERQKQQDGGEGDNERDGDDRRDRHRREESGKNKDAAGDDSDDDDDDDDDDRKWLSRTLVDLFVSLALLFLWCVASPLMASVEFQTVTHAFRVVKVGTSPSLPVPVSFASYRRYGLEDDDAPCIVLVPESNGRPRSRSTTRDKAKREDRGRGASVPTWKYAVVYFKKEIFDFAARLRVVLDRGRLARRRDFGSTVYRVVFWNSNRIVVEAVRRVADDDDDDGDRKRGTVEWDLRDMDVPCDGYRGVVGVAVWEENEKAEEEEEKKTDDDNDNDDAVDADVYAAVARASIEARLPLVRLGGEWVLGEAVDRDRWSARLARRPWPGEIATNCSLECAARRRRLSVLLH